MDPLGRGGRWLRERRARSLLERARHGGDSDVDEDDVAALLDLCTADPGSNRIAAEALEALARRAEPSPVRAAATDGLVDLLDYDDPDLVAAAARALRYVALERPGVVPELDEPYAAILSEGDEDAGRDVALDAGMVLSRVEGAAADLPATREALREALAGGPDRTRRDAAVAYAVAADRAADFEHPGEIAEGLAILGSGHEGELPPEGTAARGLAEGRTLDDAVAAFRDAAGGSQGDRRE